MKSKQFYNEINYFRGYTIFLIVWSHFVETTYANRYLDIHTSWVNTLNVLHLATWPGGSWFFVFISGFLYYAIFYRRNISYLNFIKDKILKVVMPYMLFTIAISIQAYLLPPSYLYNNSLRISSDYVVGCLFYYWYIPFIFCLFCLTPAWNVFIKCSYRWKTVIFIISIICSCLCGRNFQNPFVNVIDFSSSYLLGILVAMHYDVIKISTDDKKLSFIFIVILVSIAMITGGIDIYEYSSNDRWHQEFGKHISNCIPIKLPYCVIYVYLFLWLNRLSDYLSNIIKRILALFAKYAFTLYFGHLIIIYYLNYSYMDLPEWILSYGYWGCQVWFFCEAFIYSFVIIIIAKIVSSVIGPKYSRFVIGCS